MKRRPRTGWFRGCRWRALQFDVGEPIRGSDPLGRSGFELRGRGGAGIGDGRFGPIPGDHRDACSRWSGDWNAKQKGGAVIVSRFLVVGMVILFMLSGSDMEARSSCSGCGTNGPQISSGVVGGSGAPTCLQVSYTTSYATPGECDGSGPCVESPCGVNLVGEALKSGANCNPDTPVTVYATHPLVISEAANGLRFTTPAGESVDVRCGQIFLVTFSAGNEYVSVVVQCGGCAVTPPP